MDRGPDHRPDQNSKNKSVVMKLDKKTLWVAVATLSLGLVLGALLFGGKSTENEPPVALTEEHDHSAEALWTCSMHPQVRQEEPGACPFCGMDLIPLAEENQDDPRVLKMSNSAIALANIETSVVEVNSPATELILNGRIETDESRVQTQTTHFPGRIEKLYKNYMGQSVKVGQRVASIYSPELVAAQNELLEAKKLANTNPALLNAARKKLEFWKLTEEQIANIEASGKAMRNIDLLSNYNGILTEKMVNNGDHLKEGQAIYQVADLSQVWAVFEVYERDLPFFSLGDVISFRANGTERNYEAKINFISPTVDAQRRVVEVRADISNPENLLKPDMFIKVSLRVEGNEDLTVPKSAVLWTGKRSVVYVKLANNQGFALREVSLGKALGDHYVILEGLEAGEEVVTQGAFTLDAEAQLKGKISMMTPELGIENLEDPVFQEIEVPEVIDLREEAPATFLNQLNEFTQRYISLKDAMVQGERQQITLEAESSIDAFEQIEMASLPQAVRDHWMPLYSNMEESLEFIVDANDPESQRLEFINLSKALINALNSFGINQDSPLYVQFCPMANNNQGATWLSKEEEIINPYFGDMMLNCGNVEYTIEND